MALVHQPRRLSHVGESLGASAPRLLAAFGLELPDSAWAERPREHRVRWGGAERLVSMAPEAGGEAEGARLVWRDRLDAWARDEARRAGVRLVVGSASPFSGPTASPSPTLEVRRPGADPLRIVAGTLGDATGRRGLFSRERRESPPFRTTALTAHYRGVPGAGTLIAAFADGWLWSAPLPDGLRDVTVFGDSESAAGRSEARFSESVARVDLAGFVDGAPVTPVRAQDATPYRLDPAGARGAPPGALRERGVGVALSVGDAASALDPISGLGTMKAMHSGLLGAIAIRTALERPQHARLALGFHADRERALAADVGERVAAAYAAAGASGTSGGQRFWRRRGRARAARDAEIPPAAPPGGRLAPAPGARIETRGILDGDWIVPGDVVVLPGRRAAHRFRGAPLAPLLRAAASGGLEVRRLAERHAAAGSASAAAAAWLWREGFLVFRRPPETR